MHRDWFRGLNESSEPPPLIWCIIPFLLWCALSVCPSVRFPQHISGTQGRISSILHTHHHSGGVDVPFGGYDLWPTFGTTSFDQNNFIYFNMYVYCNMYLLLYLWFRCLAPWWWRHKHPVMIWVTCRHMRASWWWQLSQRLPHSTPGRQ